MSPKLHLTTKDVSADLRVTQLKHILFIIELRYWNISWFPYTVSSFEIIFFLNEEQATDSNQVPLFLSTQKFEFKRIMNITIIPSISLRLDLPTFIISALTQNSPFIVM